MRKILDNVCHFLSLPQKIVLCGPTLDTTTLGLPWSQKPRLLFSLYFLSHSSYFGEESGIWIKYTTQVAVPAGSHGMGTRTITWEHRIRVWSKDSDREL